MADDLLKLAEDWRTDRRLRMYAYDNVQELHKYMIQVHRSLLNTQEGTVVGYLYSKQVNENRRLKKELEKCQQMINK